MHREPKIYHWRLHPDRNPYDQGLVEDAITNCSEFRRVRAVRNIEGGGGRFRHIGSPERSRLENERRGLG